MLSLQRTNTLYATWDGKHTPDLEARDQEIMTTFQQERPWGMDAAIDLYGCHPDIIRDPVLIGAFAADLCQRIQMRPYGKPRIVRFGDNPDVTGYTLIQLIQTSDIAAHFIERGNAACLNVFSCSAFPPYSTASFCQAWFKAQAVEMAILFRGSGKPIENEGS